MNVFHLISSSGFFGAEGVLTTLAQGFNRGTDKAAVGIIVDDRRPSSAQPLIRRLTELNIPYYLLRSRGRIDFSTVNQLKTHLNAFGADIIHSHNYKSDIIAWLGHTGRPIISTAHGFTDVTQQVTFYERLDRLILRLFFNRVVVVTDKLLPNFPQKKRRVIRNGLDLSRFRADTRQRETVRRNYGITNDQILVATVGRLSKEKNQDLLIRAALRIAPYQPKLRFLIAGSGPEEAKLKELIRQKGGENNIIMAGQVDDIAPLYQAMDIFVLCSLTEGVPLTILEAMAARVPVITTRVGGIPEIIDDNRSGILINSEDETALAEKIGDLCRHETKRLALTDQAFIDVSQKFSMDKMIEEYRKVYNEILS